jgi:parallel beta-helix repeat protein
MLAATPFHTQPLMPALAASPKPSSGATRIPCPYSLQAAVAVAAPGSTLDVTGCGPYREVVTVTHPMTIIGASITGATATLQSGDLQISNAHDVVIRGARVTDSSGACISADDSRSITIEDSLMYNCGQEGFHFSHVNGLFFTGNRVTSNNASGAIDPEWEAGGGKAGTSANLVFSGNEVDHNGGPGIWFDISCSHVVIRNNLVHDNTYAGILFETSTGAQIYANSVWSNGADKAVWGWGAGILISSSSRAEVHDNVLAWNASSGISVISQDRTDAPGPVADNDIHDNVTAGLDGSWLMFWAQDWSGQMFQEASNNRGANDRYWAPGPEDGRPRFAWDGQSLATLTSFDATLGEQGGRYLSTAAIKAILSANNIPTTAP